MAQLGRIPSHHPIMSQSRYVIRKPKIDMAQHARGMQRLPTVLRRMGFSSVRPGQDAVVSSLMAGRDTIGILPTGTGKSACFIIPTLCLGLKTLVFLPLISLMSDQVQSAVAKGARVGSISSHNPALHAETMRAWLRGDLDLLYVAPERLRRDDFMAAMRQVPPDMIVLDEAHCISSWSVTFRPAYKVIGDFITALQPKIVAAFTATCPPQVENDIRHVMCIEDAHLAMHYPRRRNLDLRSAPWDGASSLVTMMEHQQEGASIVYCAKKIRTEELALELQKMSGQYVGFYHGGMTPSARNNTQAMFMSGELPWLCATNAFGMGIDKSNIRNVIHRDIPGSLEAQMQEDGRAGRDGGPSLCLTYFSQDSVRTQEYLINLNSPSFAEVRQVFKALSKEAARHDGVVNLSYEEIASHSGLKAPRLGAIMNILAGARVTDRAPAEEKICSIRLRNRVDQPQLTSLMETLQQCGLPASDGYVDIALSTLETEMGVQAATVKRRLADFAKQQLIDFVPPETQRPIRIIGGVELVDAAQVDELRDKAFWRLSQTIEYATVVPDVDKHQYVEDKLGIKSC